MRRPLPTWTLAIVAIVALSGCSGTGGKAASAPSSSMEPAGTAAIEGLVLDDQLVPVSGADVGIPALALTTTSGPDGSFRFQGLAGGVVEVVGTKTGFATARVRVPIEEAVTSKDVELRLVAIAVPKEAYTDVIPGEGFLACGVKAGALTFGAFQFCEADPHHEPYFRFEVEQARGLVSVVLELAWNPTVPGTAASLREELWTNPKCSPCAEEVRYNYEGVHEYKAGPSPIKMVFGNATSPFIENIKSAGRTPLKVFAHVSRDVDPPVVVVVQQPVHFYVSVFYNSSPAAKYTQVPA